jgi:NADPH2:quinone reductase
MVRAVVAEQLGPPENYSLREITLPPPGPQEVRVRIKAAGVSFVDVLVSAGRYQVRPEVPFTPGSECAGIVEAVGSAVTGFVVGQKVLASAGWAGIFADSANIRADSVWPMPEGMSFEEASVFMVSAQTAWHALVDRAQIKAGETLVVLGAGGATGYAAVQIGKYLGARVIASASSETKRAMAMAAGADAAVDARSENWRADVKAANGGKPVDVVFDPVGGTATEPAFRSLGWKGRHLVVGFPAGMTSLPTNLALLKGASLMGVYLGGLGESEPETGRANQTKLLELGGQGHFKPVIAATYPLERFADAMTEAAKGDGAGRIVIVTD